MAGFSKQALQHLVKRRQGRVVTVASVAGRVAFPTAGPYSVSKHAVEAYCDVVRGELFPFGVKVSILEPGFFKTNILNTEVAHTETEKIWDALSPELKEQYGEQFLKQSIAAWADAVTAWSSTDISVVVDAYFHALFSRFPRERYHVGLDSKLFFVPLSFLPTALQDFCMKTLLKFRGAPLPAAAVISSL